MSTRQYIGARYTPKFSGTINPTQAYEALEVVDNGSGTTYIARKPVPPNTPLTNTEYWLVYGSSSGAILDLQNRVSEIENTDLPAINENISNINGSILTMGGEISENTSDISGLNGRVTALERAMINPSMRVVVYSDSYGVTTGGTTPFPAKMKSELSLIDSAFYNLSQGSMGVNPNGAVPGGLSAWIDTSYALVADPDTITDVLIAMGTNDIGNLTGIDTSFSTCIGKIRTKFPNAKIHIAFIGQTYNQTVANKNAAVDAYRKASSLFKCVFIENSDIIMRDGTLLQSDHVHPNQTGADALGVGLAFGLINGILHYSATHTATFPFGASTYTLNYVISDDYVSVNLVDWRPIAGVTLSYSDFTSYDITGAAIRGVGTMATSLPAGGASGVESDLYVVLNNSKIYFKSYPAISNKTVALGGNLNASLRSQN